MNLHTEKIGSVLRQMKIRSDNRQASRADPAFSNGAPTHIGIKMNSRAKHPCMLSRDDDQTGINPGEQKNEIPLGLIEKVMHITRAEKTKLHLRGGEPLMYSQFDRFMRLVEKDPRSTTIFTDAFLTEARLDSMLRASECLAFFACVDGLHRENDAMRGDGAFMKVVAALALLLDQRRKGEYKGSVSISLMMNDGAIGKLHDFVKFFEDFGVDSIHMGFPCFIPDDIVTRIPPIIVDKLPEISWHSFACKISSDKLSELKDDISRIAARRWSPRIHFHPTPAPQDIDGFVSADTDFTESDMRHMAKSIDLLPNGDIVSREFFPGLNMQSICTASIQEMWRGPQFASFRAHQARRSTRACTQALSITGKAPGI